MFLFSVFCFSLLLLGVPDGVKAAAPDLTTVDLSTIDTTLNYSLGPTGMRGWIYVARDNKVGPDGRGYSRGGDESMTDCQPYQVLVTSIGTNTPAAGVFQTSDVLLGVNTGSNNVPVPLFTNDTRKAIGMAIGAAEAGDGWMNFKLWRAGVTNVVSLRLPLRGLAYSATAPFNCPKSAVILSNAVNVLASRSLNYGSPGSEIVALAMLASGNPNLLPTLQTFARSRTVPQPGDWFWGPAYCGVFLAEYYLKTGDTNVLPTLAGIALYCANGQDRYGTMCHGPGFNNADGSPNGTAGGYGPVNAVGVTANLAMVMAKKCLVAAGWPVDPAISAAITRGANFFGWYAQKGELQYGEHLPWGPGFHAANGKHGGAAMLFAMLGNRPVETEYWTRMSLAGYLGREYGHTGQGLSYIWEALGANVGGTNATVAYMSNIRWHLDLERRSDGSFVYDGDEQYGPSAVSDYRVVGGNNTYAGEDPTAYYVLTYALPLQQIYLTGRNANPTNVLSDAKVTNAIAAALIPWACTNFTTNQLIAALSEYDPNVRCWSALELARRASVSVATITNLTTSTNAWTRAAACVVLGQMKHTSGFAALVQCLTDSDISVRAHAAIALKKCGAAITSYIPAMLMAYTNNATDPAVINWNDPWQGANELLGNVLWGDWLLTGGVGNDDLVPYTANASRNLLYPALRAALKGPDSLSRHDAASFINSRLNLADIQAIVLDLVECATTPVMADPMWRSDGRMNSIQALAKYKGAEAVPVAMAMLNPPWVALGQGDGGESDSPNAALNAVATYGDSVRYLLPALNNYIGDWGSSDGRFTTLVSAINTITAATTAPTITNLFPVANSKVVNTTNAIAITLTGFSCRTNTVRFQNVTAPAHGTLTGTAPSLTYTPTPGYSGLDRFTFQVADRLTNSAVPATVSLIVGMPAGAGVSGQYYDNADFTNLKFTRTDPQINFDWGTSSPSNTMAADTFSVRWSGVLLAPESGNYLFSSLNSDGVRLYVNGSQVIDDWPVQSRNWTDGAGIYLTAGQKYLVQMHYYENTGDAAAKLKWTGPSFAGSNGMILAKEWLSTVAGATNLPVFAYPQSLTMLQNTNLAITLGGSANATNFSIVSGPAHGSLTGTPPAVTYTPFTNYTGVDSFTFVVNNGLSNSAPATVSIAVWAGAPVSFTWKSAVSSNWSFAGNWTSGVPGAAGQPYYTLNFTPSGTYSVTNDLNSSFAVNQLNFSGTVTLEGSSVSLASNGPVLPQINQNSANNVVINSPLELAATTAFGGLSGGSVTLNGLISGPGALIWNSPARVQFNQQTNTYSGGTIINAGQVNGPPASDKNSPFFGTGPVTINSPATLSFNRNTLTNRITLNGATLTGGNSFQTFFTGPMMLTNITTIDLGGSGGLEISGNVSGSGGLTTIGRTSWTLRGTNSYGGPTTIAAGSINYTKAAAVAPGALSISNGATANLNYTGTRIISALTLGGTNMPRGVYGSTSSSATYKDAHFSGTGTVTVPALITITNTPATAITSSAAALNATLACGGTNAAVLAYWNTVNGGTNAATWTNSAYVGAWTNVTSTNLSRTVTGLAPNTTYYFTFRGTNGGGGVWATNVLSFTTLAPPAPTVANAPGATNLSVGVAQLRGTLTNGPADVRLYWGATDGGTNKGNWANTNLLTGVGIGSFSTNVSNLLYGLTYYYRSYASNQWGTAWAAATTNFTTLRPGSSLANSAATGITTNAAALNATLACTGAVYSAYAYWNTVKGGTNTALWTNSAYVGSWTNVASTNLSLQVSGLIPSANYYFTFRATNAMDSLWATNVQSFTTLAPGPPTPVLPGSAITVSNGAPSFTFGTTAGYKYRLVYKNTLTNFPWQPVLAPPDFPLPDGWSATSTGAPMSLSDTNTAGQPQRFYRLEAANP